MQVRCVPLSRSMWIAVAMGVLSTLAWGQATTGHAVETYAEIVEPGEITFDPFSGDLFVGQGVSSDIPAPIRRVSGANLTVSDFGPSLVNPFAVLFDDDGSYTGEPDSLMIGSEEGVSLLDSVFSFESLTPAGAFKDLRLFVDTSDEDLFMFDAGDDGAFGLFLLFDPDDPANPTPAITGVSNAIGSVEEDEPEARLLSSDGTGVIAEHDLLTGVTSPARDDTGAGRLYAQLLSVRDRPGFDDGLIAWDEASGELLLFEGFDLASEPSVFGVGFAGVRDLEFGPDGALYASIASGSILRIAVPAPPPVGVLAGLGLIWARRSR